MCIYCCKIVLSYLQSADLNSDLTDDLWYRKIYKVDSALPLPIHRCQTKEPGAGDLDFHLNIATDPFQGVKYHWDIKRRDLQHQKTLNLLQNHPLVLLMTIK